MKSNYKRLGDYIREINIRNVELKEVILLGVSIQKEFIPSIANTIGTNMKTYKLVKRGQFAYGPVTSRNGDRISIALLEDYKEAMISQSYTCFEVINNNELLPEYLMMWFKRPEFDRYARYISHGSVREIFSWEDMCNVELPIPSIEEQRKIVKEYNVIENRIKLNNQFVLKLEETAQTIYNQWFVNFEFPDENCMPYKSNGGKMEFNETINKEIPKGWKVGSLKDISQYINNKILLEKLTTKNYISTENMLPNRGGVVESQKIPNVNKVNEFKTGNILISNIRPYFKKIWMATFNGGCSNDVLCLGTNNDIFSKFLYYTLERDDFFDYVMAGSKGTKMPRGDKDWIMNYPLILPDEKVLNHYNKVISSFITIQESKRKENNLLDNFKTVHLSILARKAQW
ncbi:restriction endonuclease subunit S [Sporosarcina contaminans]|uniref:Restriction endonuclease subunit S n=1 Tax=Sporosarcina contaminans TaxID=633403 RepID=A0ABW3TWA7_9BACL